MSDSRDTGVEIGTMIRNGLARRWALAACWGLACLDGRACRSETVQQDGQPGRRGPRLQGQGRLGHRRAGGISARAIARPCSRAPLIARYYYIFAVDYDKGGSWGGKSMMCTRDKIFTIRGIDGLREPRLSEDRLLRGRYRRGDRLDDVAVRREDHAGTAIARETQPQASRSWPRSGPASSAPEMIERLFRAGVGRLPHQHEPHAA